MSDWSMHKSAAPPQSDSEDDDDDLEYCDLYSAWIERNFKMHVAPPNKGLWWVKEVGRGGEVAREVERWRERWRGGERGSREMCTHMHTCSHAHMHTCSHAHAHMRPIPPVAPQMADCKTVPATCYGKVRRNVVCFVMLFLCNTISRHMSTAGCLRVCTGFRLHLMPAKTTFIRVQSPLSASLPQPAQTS